MGSLLFLSLTENKILRVSTLKSNNCLNHFSLPLTFWLRQKLKLSQCLSDCEYVHCIRSIFIFLAQKAIRGQSVINQTVVYVVPFELKILHLRLVYIDHLLPLPGAVHIWHVLLFGRPVQADLLPAVGAGGEPHPGVQGVPVDGPLVPLPGDGHVGHLMGPRVCGRGAGVAVRHLKYWDLFLLGPQSRQRR